MARAVRSTRTATAGSTSLPMTASAGSWRCCLC
jgi:hypothetical protein